MNIVERVPVGRGGVAGAFAYIGGGLLTTVLMWFDGDLQQELEMAETQGIQASVIDVILWAFHSAHHVEIESSFERGGTTETQSGNLFAEVSTSVPKLVYYAVPVIILVVTGYLVADGALPDSTGQAIQSGAATVVGYLPVTVAARYFSEASGSATILGEQISYSIAPALGTSILLAGIVFPVVLGAVGGFLWFKRAERTGRR